MATPEGVRFREGTGPHDAGFPGHLVTGLSNTLTSAITMAQRSLDFYVNNIRLRALLKESPASCQRLATSASGRI